MEKPPVDLDKPVTNPALVAAMDAFIANASEESENAMLAALKEASFLAPAVIAPSLPKPAVDGAAVTTEATTIQFEMVANQKSQQFFPAFTDWDQLRLWKNVDDQKTVVMRLTDYATLLATQGSGIVVNPFGHNMVFSKDHVLSLAGVPALHTIKKGEHVLVGEPAVYPQALVDALAAHMRTVPALRAAWLHLKIIGKEESFLVTVDSDGDPTAFFPGIAEAARPHIGPKESLDLIPASEDFAHSITESSDPFYRRS